VAPENSGFSGLGARTALEAPFTQCYGHFPEGSGEAPMPDASVSFSEVIPANIRRDPAKARGVGGIFVFRISGENGGTWTLNLKDDLGVQEGEVADPDCLIEVTNEEWRKMTENPNSAMQVYFNGKIKVTGNALLALRLQAVIS
jgi:putative sterol carrier protein